MFNSLLYGELQNNQYVHFFDSNESLTYEMFSNFTGRINNIGLKNIFVNTMKNIRVDLERFPITVTNLDFDCKKAIESTKSNQSSQNHLFRI